MRSGKHALYRRRGGSGPKQKPPRPPRPLPVPVPASPPDSLPPDASPTPAPALPQPVGGIEPPLSPSEPPPGSELHRVVSPLQMQPPLPPVGIEPPPPTPVPTRTQLALRSNPRYTSESPKLSAATPQQPQLQPQPQPQLQPQLQPGNQQLGFELGGQVQSQLGFDSNPQEALDSPELLSSQQHQIQPGNQQLGFEHRVQARLQLGFDSNANNKGENNGNHNNELELVGVHASVETPLGFDHDGDDEGCAASRWPRRETLALLKLRAEMDAMFREAGAKQPLWEVISRELRAMGYTRSAKKCKEKFENVHKYYKKTKEGKAIKPGRKNYRFFSQLEGIYATTNCTPTAVNNTSEIHGQGSSFSSPIHKEGVSGGGGGGEADCTSPFGLSSSSGGESNEPIQGRKKRKRKSSLKVMMDFFEHLMERVIKTQRQLHQELLEAMERRENERIAREEVWRKQEAARLGKELELKTQERALVACRDAALVSFIRRASSSGQTFQLDEEISPPPFIPMSSMPSSIPSSIPSSVPSSDSHGQTKQTKPPSSDSHGHTKTPFSDSHGHTKPLSSDSHVQTKLPPPPPPSSSPPPSSLLDPNNKRWPKHEVLALIKLRSGLEAAFREPGPKGRIWKQVSREMSGLGFNRSARRCREKWENINKYFLKTRDRNKKRSENSKTCPYFHQLDSLYRKGLLLSPIPLPPNLSNTVEEDHPQIVAKGSQLSVALTKKESSSGDPNPMHFPHSEGIASVGR